MNKIQIKPGFEVIFSLSVLVIMALPPLVFGQGQKDVDITIRNRDTIINGQNIKSLSPQDRLEALKDINSLTGTDAQHNGEQRMTIRRRGMMDGGQDRITMEQRRFNGRDSMKFNSDRTMQGRPMQGGDNMSPGFGQRFDKRGTRDSSFAFNFRRDDNMNDRPGERMMDRELFFDGQGARAISFRGKEFRRNTQNFNFSNTGSDGITTTLNFRVSEPSPEGLKRLGITDKEDLEISDLTLTPEFSTGKVLLLINLPAKAAADVKFTDSEGKVLWTEKAANGEIKKSFPLGLNGIYYLHVKQAGKTAVKRIVKE